MGRALGSADVGNLFADMVRLRKKIAYMEESLRSKIRDRELYEFQRDEIDRERIIPGEDESLSADLRKLSRAGELKKSALRLFEELSEDDHSVTALLGALSVELGSMASADTDLQEYREKLDGLEAAAADIALFFCRYADDIDDDPSLLAELEDRLAVLERLKKKYGPSLEDVLAYRDTIAAELDAAGASGEDIERHREKLAVTEKRLFACAGELSDKRRAAAPLLVVNMADGSANVCRCRGHGCRGHNRRSA